MACIAATIIIALVILGYVIYVVRRKIRNIKNGKFCDCECDSCNMNGKCKQ